VGDLEVLVRNVVVADQAEPVDADGDRRVLADVAVVAAEQACGVMLL